MKSWHYAALAGAFVIALALLVGLREREPPPEDPPPDDEPVAVTPSAIRSVPEWIETLNRKDGEHDIEGEFHIAKPEVEKKLWRVVRHLPVIDGGDRLLFRALQDVYTQYHENYLVGYAYHFPYLDSRKTLRLAEKLEEDYPDSPFVPDALFLKAFVWRVKPPEEGEAIPETAESQLDWEPDADKAREIYRELIERYPEHELAAKAKKILEKKELRIRLPTSYDEDPRNW